MATAPEAKTGEKRAARSRRTDAPALKKQKTSASVSTSTPVSTAFASPVAQSPAVASLPGPGPDRKPVRLQTKVVDGRPLPSLPEAQALNLLDDEYQSIAARAVLAASLERSRLRWVRDGVLDRYWVKPESGKNAKPAPPNNPDVKCMKIRGECRIRIEPHLFVADMYVEEKPKSHTAPKQPVQQYRHPQAVQQPYTPPSLPSRALPPLTQNGQQLLPAQAATRPPAPVPRAQQAPSPIPGQQQGQKPSDPVISMLATRASSDPELKTLMKEVATGNATQDQLKVFQRHIDELTGIIQRQKRDQPDDMAATRQPQKGTVPYNVPVEAKPAMTVQPLQPQQPPGPTFSAAVQQPATPYGHQQSWSAPTTTTKLPVILAFKDPGATEDRFLFPVNSILEALSPQHLLVSFIVTRQGSEAVGGIGLEPHKEYWQPLTIMIEVAYGREELLNCIRRWVNPAEEVRKHMEDVMRSHSRVPDSFLALRLPFKSLAVPESEDVSHEATPVAEVKVKSRSSARPMKKATAIKAVADSAKAQSDSPVQKALETSTPVSQPSTLPDSKIALTDEDADTTMGEAATPSDHRPRRAMRKSARVTD